MSVKNSFLLRSSFFNFADSGRQSSVDSYSRILRLLRLYYIGKFSTQHPAGIEPGLLGLNAVALPIALRPEGPSAADTLAGKLCRMRRLRK